MEIHVYARPLPSRSSSARRYKPRGIYHHPGRGHRDSLEYLFAPEYASYVPADDPKNLTPEDNFVYTFVRKDDNATIDIRVKEERSSIMSRVPLRLSPCLLLIFGYII